MQDMLLALDYLTGFGPLSLALPCAAALLLSNVWLKR
jgi:hypothetical protein